MIETRLKGVTFSNRQEVIAQLHPGEPVRLRREPANPFDRNAIQVVTSTGQVVGYLDRHLAGNLAPQMDAVPLAWQGQVQAVLGSGLPDSPFGVQIGFQVPEATLEPSTP